MKHLIFITLLVLGGLAYTLIGVGIFWLECMLFPVKGVFVSLFLIITIVPTIFKYAP